MADVVEKSLNIQGQRPFLVDSDLHLRAAGCSVLTKIKKRKVLKN